MNLITYITTAVFASIASLAGAIEKIPQPEPEVIYVEAEPQTVYVEVEPEGRYANCGVILKDEDIAEVPEGYQITITMQNGNRFTFISEDGDLCKGEIIAAIFDDNGTQEVYDDSIISFRYGGWVSDEELQNWIK